MSLDIYAGNLSKELEILLSYFFPDDYSSSFGIVFLTLFFLELSTKFFFSSSLLNLGSSEWVDEGDNNLSWKGEAYLTSYFSSGIDDLNPFVLWATF